MTRPWPAVPAALVCAAFSHALWAIPSAVNLTLGEIVSTSELVVVATVQARESRWNSRGNLIVTDYDLYLEEVLKGSAGQVMRITLSGGTVGDETHQVSTSVHLQFGYRYLLFIEDAGREVFSPFAAGGTAIIREGTPGTPDAVSIQPWIIEPGDSPATLTFDAVVDRVRDEIRLQAGSEPPQTPDSTQPPGGSAKTRPEDNQIVSGADLPFKAYDDHGTVPGGAAAPPRILPEGPDIAPGPVARPHRSPGDAQQFQGLARGGDGQAPPGPDYYWIRRPPAPVVFDPFPLDWYWSPYDQYMMSEWNRYGGNFFQVVPPDNTWAWGNGRFELAGFPPDSQMIAQFGEPWDSNTLGITYYRWIGNGPIVEADIAINPAFGWTLSLEIGTRESNDTWNFQQTMLHELGHAWGLQHPFEHQDVWWDSVMNYSPKSYRIPLLTTDDTNAVRSAYSSVAMHDAHLALYTTQDNPFNNRAQYVPTQPIPGFIYAGDQFAFSNQIKLENTGTAVFSDPEIEVYLVPKRYSWTNARYLRTANYSFNANPFETWTLGVSPSTVGVDVPPGRYYPALFLRTSDDYLGNNSAWPREFDSLQVQNVPEYLDIEQFWKTAGFSGEISSGGYFDALAVLDADTYYDFSLCPSVGGFATFDTTLAIYDQGGFFPLAYDDDTCGLSSRISDFKPAVSGTYLIRVRAWDGNNGMGSFGVAYRAQDTLVRTGFE